MPSFTITISNAELSRIRPYLQEIGIVRANAGNPETLADLEAGVRNKIAQWAEGGEVRRKKRQAKIDHIPPGLS